MLKLAAVILMSPLCLAAPQVGFGDASPDEIAQIRAGTYLETFDENPQYSFNYKVADDVEQTFMAMNEDRNGDQVTGSYQYVDPFGSLIIVTYTAGPMGYSETREVREGFVEIRPRPQKPSSGSSSIGSNSGSSFSSGPSSFSGSSGSSFNSRPQSTITFSTPVSSSSSGQFSSSQTSSNAFNSNDIVSSVVSQVQPLITQTVSSAVSGSSRPSTFTPVSRPVPPPSPPPPASNDIVSQVVAQISPLVSQTVSSAVSGSSRSSTQAAPSVSRPVAAPAPVSGSSGSLTDLFGSGGDFNVKFNTPSFNIEY